MKLKLPFLTLLLTCSITAQEIFTDCFVGAGAPFSLQVINNELYVGLFDPNTNGMAYIQKVSFDDPTNKTTIAEAPYAVGFLKMTYDENTNILYAGTNSTLYKIDLSNTLPIQGEPIPDSSVNINGGLIVKNNNLYFRRNNQIKKKDVSDALFPETLVYNGSNLLVLGEIWNNELYFFELSDGNNDIDLLKINLSDNNPTPTLVSAMTGYSGFVQDAHINNGYLYTTIEFSGESSIVKFNLNETLPLTTQFVVTPDNSPLGIVNYLTDLYYATASQNIFRLEDENLSLQRNKLTQLEVYPNPVNDYLTISSVSTSNFSFKIRSVTGQIVLKGEVENRKINSSSLPSGVYFLELTSDHQQQVIKVLKN